MFAPAGTQAAIIERLNIEFGKAIASPDVRERLTAQGFEIRTSSPAELGALLKSDLDKYARVIREANIRLE